MLGVRLFGAGDVDVEAVLVGVVWFAAEVPLADAGGRVAGVVSASAIVTSSSGRYLVQSGTISFGLSGIGRESNR